MKKKIKFKDISQRFDEKVEPMFFQFLYFGKILILVGLIFLLIILFVKKFKKTKRKITGKEKSIYFLVLILVVILGGYIKSLMYGGNEEIALIMAIILAFVVFFGAIFLTKKYERKWGLK